MIITEMDLNMVGPWEVAQITPDLQAIITKQRQLIDAAHTVTTAADDE